MTEEKLKECVFLSKQIREVEDMMNIWKKATGYDISAIRLCLETHSVKEVKISEIISFEELREKALKILNEKLNDYKKRFENL